jgi:S1-C subfamily serine protease
LCHIAFRGKLAYEASFFFFPPEELMKGLCKAVAVVVLGLWLSTRAQAESKLELARFAAPYRQAAPAVQQLQGQTEAELVGISRVPKFGFRSSFGFAQGVLGEHVTEVRLGSPADRMRLAPGDAILAVNGQPLRTAESWYEAVDRAAAQDGWVTLKILERRSGQTAYRTANLFKLNVR